MTRFTNLSQIANCSAFVRAQLEKHRDAFDGEAAEGEYSAEIAAYKASHEPGQKRRNRPEQDAGKMLVQWIDALVLKDGLKPGLFFAHTPNGGARSAIEAAIFAGQGVRKGWPDYNLALPRKQYHGMYIELKAPTGDKPDIEQLNILQRLESMGYKVCVCWGFDEARYELERYLDLIK